MTLGQVQAVDAARFCVHLRASNNALTQQYEDIENHTVL